MVVLRAVIEAKPGSGSEMVAKEPPDGLQNDHLGVHADPGALGPAQSDHLRAQAQARLAIQPGGAGTSARR